QSSTTVTATQTKTITLAKSVSESSYAAVGDLLHYSYLVTNTGNVTLAGPATVNDDKAAVSCPAGALAPNGGTVTCTATYAVTQADIDSGSVTNHATAHANGVDSNQSSTTVDAKKNEKVKMVKIVS